MVRGLAAIGVCALAWAAGSAAAADTSPSHAREVGAAVHDARRFYLYVEPGLAWVTDVEQPAGVEIDASHDMNLVLGGGVGYDLDEHWGVELQVHGTEPDLRRAGRKAGEYSSITLVPAVRFRWPLGAERRLVPYVTAGVGAAAADVNDTGNPDIVVETEAWTIVGSIAAGLEWFAADDVALGVSLHGFVHPDRDTDVVLFDSRRRVLLREHGTSNDSGVSALAHLRLFPGQPAAPGQPRRLLLADHGPFDVPEPRAYAYGTVANVFPFDGDFAGGAELDGPGDMTIGGAVGMNVDGHWGAEVQLVVSEPALALPPWGNFVELSVFSVLPLARFRWPLLDGRLVPFATAGVGVAFFDLNDASPTAILQGPGGQDVLVRRVPKTAVGTATLAGAVGVGLEYFLNHHVSVTGGATFYLYRPVTARVSEPGAAPAYGELDPSGVAPMLRLTAYLP